MTFSFDVTVATIQIESGFIKLTDVNYIYAGDPYYCAVLTHGLPTTLDSRNFNCINLGGTPGSGEGQGSAPTLNITNITIQETIAEQIQEIEREVKAEGFIIKTVVWAVLLIILIILALLLDALRRNRTILLGTQIIVLFLAVLLFFLLGWMTQNAILQEPIQISFWICAVGWAIAVITLIAVAYITDIARRKKKIGMTIQITTLITTAILLFIVGWIIQDILSGQTLTENLLLIIIGAVIIFILFIGIVIEITKKKPQKTE